MKKWLVIVLFLLAPITLKSNDMTSITRAASKGELAVGQIFGLYCYPSEVTSCIEIIDEDSEDTAR
jgi:hypothetical protein